MAKQWSDVELWAMAEQLSGIMDALKHGERAPAAPARYRAQAELPLGHGGNVIPFPRRRPSNETSDLRRFMDLPTGS